MSPDKSSHFAASLLSLLVDIDHPSFIPSLKNLYEGEESLLWRNPLERKIGFWKAVYDFLDAPEPTRASNIYSMFLEPLGHKSLHLNPLLTSSIKVKIDLRQVGPDLFDPVFLEVEEQMIDLVFVKYAGLLTEAIEDSWVAVSSRMVLEDFGKVLFMNWFAREPSIVALFKRDLRKHGAMLTGMVRNAVSLMSDPGSFVPPFLALGERHAKFGAQVWHFRSLKVAMLESFEEILGSEFSQTFRDSWEIIMEVMARIMSLELHDNPHCSDTLSQIDSEDSKSMTASKSISSSIVYFIIDTGLLTRDYGDFIQHSFDQVEIEVLSSIYRLTQSLEDSLPESEWIELHSRFIASKKLSLPYYYSSLFEKAVKDSSLTSAFNELREHLENKLASQSFPEITPSVREAVLNIWKNITENYGSASFGKILFMNFFEKAQEVQKLFQADMNRHSRMISSLMTLAIDSLEDLKPLIQSLIILGRKHRDYGATAPYFDALGSALVETLQSLSTIPFGEFEKKSWEIVYRFLSRVMLAGMKDFSDFSYDASISSEIVVTDTPEQQPRRKNSRRPAKCEIS